jgi:REP element-mobilizing transposase RayT
MGITVTVHLIDLARLSMSRSAAMAAPLPSSATMDYALYHDLLATHCRAAEVEVWAWCLTPNHVHLILVPSDPDGLRRALRASAERNG